MFMAIVVVCGISTPPDPSIYPGCGNSVSNYVFLTEEACQRSLAVGTDQLLNSARSAGLTGAYIEHAECYQISQ